MNQSGRNKSILKKYIPQQAVDIIADWIYKYNFKLKIKKSRSSKTGDYTPPRKEKNHLITINHDLNKYEFLLTLIHEIAHLVVYEKHKGKVPAHGKEWKSEYGKLLNYFLLQDKLLMEDEKIFPKEISSVLHRHILRPSAASCSDLSLSRVLRKYDAYSELLLLEKIPAGEAFRIASAKTKHASEVFIKEEKRRTRFRCIHLHTKKEYFIHPLCRVVLV